MFSVTTAFKTNPNSVTNFSKLFNHTAPAFVFLIYIFTGFAAKMKANAKIQTKREDTAVRKLQIWWSRINGSFAAKMKARAEMHLMQEEQEQTAAAVRMQRWWIHVNGGFAAKMKANAQIQLMKEEEEMNNAARKIQGKNIKIYI